MVKLRLDQESHVCAVESLERAFVGVVQGQWVVGHDSFGNRLRGEIVHLDADQFKQNEEEDQQRIFSPPQTVQHLKELLLEVTNPQRSHHCDFFIQPSKCSRNPQIGNVYENFGWI